MKVYLICTNQMDNYADVANIDQPVWLIESKSGQYVPRCFVSESRIAKAAAKEVECGGC